MADPTTEVAGPPSLEEARGWIGFEVDDLSGGGVGRAQDLYVDEASGEPVWLIAKLGRIGARLVAIPLRDCAGAAGRVWVAHERATMRSAPVVDPARPLMREHELAICAHFGIGEAVGRAAEVAGRQEGSVTAAPPS